MQALNLVLVLGGHITLGVFQCLQASTSYVEVIPLKVADTEHVGTGSYLWKLIKSPGGLGAARREYASKSCCVQGSVRSAYNNPVRWLLLILFILHTINPRLRELTQGHVISSWWIEAFSCASLFDTTSGACDPEMPVPPVFPWCLLGVITNRAVCPAL